MAYSQPKPSYDSNSASSSRNENKEMAILVRETGSDKKASTYRINILALRFND